MPKKPAPRRPGKPFAKRSPGGRPPAGRPASGRPPAPRRPARPRPKPAPVAIGGDSEDSGESRPGERLQKVLASAGVASRRECEELITEGRVQVDGEIVTELGVRVDRNTQEIKVDGEVLKWPRLSYFALHKPTGVVTTARDPAGRPRVIDLLPPSVGRVFPVGRLDLESEGLILLTNDGELANQLTHPKHGVEKTYEVQVAGHMEPDVLNQLKRGVYLSEGYAHAVHARIKTKVKKSTLLEMVLDEGRNREVRRLLARVGHKVQRLTRVAVGPVRLGDLPRGAYRPLTQDEVRKLREAAAAGPKPETEQHGMGARKPFGKRPPGKPAIGRKPAAVKAAFGKGPGASSGLGGKPGGKPMGRKPVGGKTAAGKPGMRKPPRKPFVAKATGDAPEFQRRVLGSEGAEGQAPPVTPSEDRPTGRRPTGGRPAYGKSRSGQVSGRPGRPGGRPAGGKPPAGKPRFRKSAEGGAAGGGKPPGRKPKPLMKRRRPPRPSGGSDAT